MKFVAFLDLLGFGSFIENNDHEEAKRKIWDVLARDIQAGLSDEKYMQDRPGRVIADMSSNTINNVIISDTIVLWTIDDSLHELSKLINCVYYLLWFEFQYVGFMMRGAITLGEIDYLNIDLNEGPPKVSQSTLIGKALVEAYQLEKAQEWAGCVVSDEVIKHISRQDEDLVLEFNKSLKRNDMIIRHQVPTKFGNKEMYAINWVSGGNLSSEERIREMFAKHKKSIDSHSVEIKIKNTIDFVRYVEENIGRRLD